MEANSLEVNTFSNVTVLIKDTSVVLWAGGCPSSTDLTSFDQHDFLQGELVVISTAPWFQG